MAGLRDAASRLILGTVLIAGNPTLSAARGMPPIPGAPATAAPGEAIEGLRITLDYVDLEPITTQELAGSGALPQSAPRLSASAGGSGLRAEGGLQVTPLRSTIERELPTVWEYRRRADAAGSPMPQVRVEFEGVGGRDQFSPVLGGAPLPVQVRPSRVSRRLEDDGIEVFSGGVILEIPVQALQQSGRYRGRLWITVEAL